MKEELNKIVESAPQPSSGVSIHTSTLTVQEKFRCSAADLYRALTDKMVFVFKFSIKGAYCFNVMIILINCHRQ